MMQPSNSFLYPLALGFLLVLILKYFEMSYSHSETKTSWTKRFLEKFSNEVFLKSLDASQVPLKRAVVMNTTLNTKRPEFSDMSKIQKWQHFLRRRFQSVENSYYPVVDELKKKLVDLDIHTKVGPLKMPDFEIHQFSFIRDWQDGDKSSKQVYAILKTMDMKLVAETQLIRRLDHYMHGREDTVIGDYVKPCKNLILVNSVPLYQSYLEMLVRYFAKLTEIDAGQEKVTWIEQMHTEEGSVRRKIEDMSLNQVMRQLDHQVIPFNGSRYTVGDNLICLDEELARGAYCVHWLFAPKSYIDELKKQFKITDVMDIKQEASYIKKLIGAYIHEKV